MTITIKRILSFDLSSLQHISRQTFAETFSSANSEENMKKYLEEAFSSEKLLNELSNPDSEFYVAILNEEVIGYLKINFGKAQTEKQKEEAMEIERIYVLQIYHGKKVGQYLYDYAIEKARAKNVSNVWLGVWQENPRAIRFYEKNGFVKFDKHVFTLGDDDQTDIMMRLEL